MRVRVFDSKMNELGLGNIVDYVTVYAIRLPDGGYESAEYPEGRPTDYLVKSSGGKLVAFENNPKIKMDDGRIFYGCSVYWEGFPDPNIFALN